jgi:hypothetical protein
MQKTPNIQNPTLVYSNSPVVVKFDFERLSGVGRLDVETL